jgi:hypothetical protein
MDTTVSFPGVEWRGVEADRSPASNADVKNAWSYTSTPQYASVAWHSVKKSTKTTLPVPFILQLLSNFSQFSHGVSRKPTPKYKVMGSIVRLFNNAVSTSEFI